MGIFKKKKGGKHRADVPTKGWRDRKPQEPAEPRISPIEFFASDPEAMAGFTSESEPQKPVRLPSLTEEETVSLDSTQEDEPAPLALPTIEVPELEPAPRKDAAQVPQDELSSAFYLYYGECRDEDDYANLLDKLTLRSQIISRREDLDEKILKLQEESLSRETIIEDFKFHKHLESVGQTADEDETERELESMDQEPEFVAHRNSLKSTLTLLSRLEMTRGALIQSHLNLLDELCGLLTYGENELSMEIAMRIGQERESLTAIRNHATSDGEIQEEEESEATSLEDFLEHLKEQETDTVIKSDGDSLFHLD